MDIKFEKNYNNFDMGIYLTALSDGKVNTAEKILFWYLINSRLKFFNYTINFIFDLIILLNNEQRGTLWGYLNL